jgi:hypothetical protein
MNEDEATAQITERVLAFFEPEERVNPWDNNVLETLVSVLHTLGISDERVERSVMFIVAQKIADDMGLDELRQACEPEPSTPGLHLV